MQFSIFKHTSTCIPSCSWLAPGHHAGSDEPAALQRHEIPCGVITGFNQQNACCQLQIALLLSMNCSCRHAAAGSASSCGGMAVATSRASTKPAVSYHDIIESALCERSSCYGPVTMSSKEPQTLVYLQMSINTTKNMGAAHTTSLVNSAVPSNCLMCFICLHFGSCARHAIPCAYML